MSLDARIEAILFYRGEPVPLPELARLLGVSSGEIEIALVRLEKRLEESGMRLMRKDESLLLATAPEAAEIIESLAKEELAKSLGSAGLETLAIILYRGPLSRAALERVAELQRGFVGEAR